MHVLAEVRANGEHLPERDLETHAGLGGGIRVPAEGLAVGPKSLNPPENEGNDVGERQLENHVPTIGEEVDAIAAKIATDVLEGVGNTPLGHHEFSLDSHPTQWKVGEATADFVGDPFVRLTLTVALA